MNLSGSADSLERGNFTSPKKKSSLNSAPTSTWRLWLNYILNLRVYFSYQKLQQIWLNLSYIDLIKCILGVSLLMLLAGICMELHYQTYVWQSTSLADFIKPVERTKCVYNGIDLNDDKSYRHHEQSKVDPAISSSLRNPSLKIGLLMVYDNREGSWDPALMQKVITNRKMYCSLHGYDLIDASDEIVQSRPTAWSKISATMSHLNKYDYIFYIDMDVVIMDLNRPVNIYLQDLSTADASQNKKIDFIMTGDWNGPNTGIWFARNSTWMTWFLSEAWKQTQLIPKTSPEGIPLPFEYEQRAFHYMLNTETWKERGLEAYQGKGWKDVSNHFLFLPQCCFNSYSIHPFYWKGEREVSQYVPGDFLVHFAGKKGKAKTYLLEYYLSEAEKKHRQYQI